MEQPLVVCCEDISYESGYRGAIKLLSQPDPPDATILGMKEGLAFGAMRGI